MQEGKIEKVKNYEDIIHFLKSDYNKYDYFPNVYYIEDNKNYYFWSGSPDVNNSIRIYTIQKWNEKDFESILERETRNIDIHRIKVYEYLISNYNTTNELIEFNDIEVI